MIMQPFRSRTIKFIHGCSLLILLFPTLGFGLNCHYCKSTPATDNEKVSPCAEGEETEIRECVENDPDIKRDDNYHCQYIQSVLGKRTHLGCKYIGSGGILDPQYNKDRYGNRDFYCRSDGCNFKPDNKLKCLSCDVKRNNLCGKGEEPKDAPCMLADNMCFTLVTNSGLVKGCMEKFPFYHYKYSQYSTATEPFCVKESDKGCFCFTSLCNTYSSEEEKKEQEQQKLQGNKGGTTSLFPAIFFSLKLYTLSTLFVILY